MPKRVPTRALSNSVRIIGGKWRGKKLAFPSAEGLRPTPDRVRETVFNWLQLIIPGSRVLDLFAGSGVFALEALSRGAAAATLVDNSTQVIAQLNKHVNAMHITSATVVKSDALIFLQHASGATFDVVFLDPPYGKELLAPCVAALESNGWLAPQAYIYLEAESALQQLPLPENWQLHRSKTGGQVGYHLAIRQQAA